MESGQAIGFISTVVEMELLVKPNARKELRGSDRAEAFLRETHNLAVPSRGPHYSPASCRCTGPYSSCSVGLHHRGHWARRAVRSYYRQRFHHRFPFNRYSLLLPGRLSLEGGAMPPKTMFEKIWDAHVVHEEPGRPAILYIDLHLVHEVSSPQAFDGLRIAGRKVRRTDLTVATADHNVPTWDRSLPTTDEVSRNQLEALSLNCEEFGVTVYDMHSPLQGHSPHHRPGAGVHPAGQDHRLRRQPHLHPRRLRGLRPGHRHVGGGARPGHPDPAPERAQDHGGPGQWAAALRGDRQGPDPGHHRADRDTRRRRPRHRVHRRGPFAPYRWMAA